MQRRQWQLHRLQRRPDRSVRHNVPADPRPRSTHQPTRIGLFFDFQASRLSGYLYFPDNGLGTSLSANSPYLYYVAPYSTNIGTSGAATFALIQFGPGTCTYNSNLSYVNAYWPLIPKRIPQLHHCISLRRGLRALF